MGNNFFNCGKLLVVLMFLVTALLHSCREECAYKPDSQLIADFHSVVQGIDMEWPLDIIALHGLGREDSLLYSERGNISSVRLPLNGSATESGFIFVFGEYTDTVRFSYEVLPVFISQECGFVHNFDLRGASATNNLIDSVVIVTREITSFDETNIRIYH